MDGKRRGFLVALVIGLLAGPALALGATQVFGSEAAAAAPAAATASGAATAAALTAPSAAADASPDLGLACNAEAATLLAGEAAGTLNDVQQAALDALRPICAAAGYRLDEPAPAAGQAASPTTTSGGDEVTGGTAPGSYEDDEYGEYDDDEYELDDHGSGGEPEDEFEGYETEGED